jgi:HD-GYP domain-containing protein (c-di-GMP phosphodiesterase class II)
MTTTRPYQKAMEVTYVLERLREMAHKRFDVNVIEALVRSHAKGGLIPTERAAPQAPALRDAGTAAS